MPALAGGLNDSGPPGLAAIIDHFQNAMGRRPATRIAVPPGKKWSLDCVLAGQRDNDLLLMTTGLTKLETVTSPGPTNGWGQELVVAVPMGEGDSPPRWALDFLVSAADFLVSSRRGFEQGEPFPIDERVAGVETAIAMVDPLFGELRGPNGNVSFMRIVTVPEHLNLDDPRYDDPDEIAYELKQANPTLTSRPFDVTGEGPNPDREPPFPRPEHDDSWLLAEGVWSDGLPIIVRLNDKLGPVVASPQFPVGFRVTWKFTESDKRGYPSKNDSDALESFEGRLIEALENRGSAILVGVVTHAGTRDFVAYSSNADTTQAAIVDAFKDDPPMPIQIYCMPDPEWREYQGLKGMTK